MKMLVERMSSDEADITQISRPSVVPQKDSLLSTPSTSGHTADTTLLSAWRWPCGQVMTR